MNGIAIPKAPETSARRSSWSGPSFLIYAVVRSLQRVALADERPRRELARPVGLQDDVLPDLQSRREPDQDAILGDVGDPAIDRGARIADRDPLAVQAHRARRDRPEAADSL